MYIQYRPAWLRLRQAAFTCVGWQVALCDPIWQATLHSYMMGSHKEIYTTFNLLTLNNSPSRKLSPIGSCGVIDHMTFTLVRFSTSGQFEPTFYTTRLSRCETENFRVTGEQKKFIYTPVTTFSKLWLVSGRLNRPRYGFCPSVRPFFLRATASTGRYCWGAY